jgi:hypothetical protein
MNKKYLWMITVLVVLVGGTYFALLYRPSIQSFVGDVGHSAENYITEVLPQKLHYPAPLRVFTTHRGTLTLPGVLAVTNKERLANARSVLVLNETLNVVAMKKVDDMFAKQYFEHISPDGKSASDLAKDSGYAYVVIGENLALGNFKDDTDLVAAWMASPGHRANILNGRFEEIGLAVKEGLYEGKTMWLAVQTFAVPASACPATDAPLQSRIKIHKSELVNLESRLGKESAEIQSRSFSDGRSYNEHVDSYNALVAEYNALAEQTKKEVANYNETVRLYNICLEG